MERDELLVLIAQAAREKWPALDLGDQGLDELPAEIGCLPHLERLDLRYNHLTALPAALGELASLRELDLRHNQLASLASELGRLGKLQKLVLGNNRLSELPAGMGRLAALEILDLRYNQLGELPAALCRLASLNSLNLRGNHLRALPPEVGRLRALSWLDLRENQLTAVPAELWELERLVYLDLRANRLAGIAPELGGLAALEELRLEGNQIPELPPELGCLSRLKRLTLGGNQLRELPPEIGRLLNLRRLDLDDNQLAVFPAALGALQGLVVLDLKGNRLSELRPEIGQLAALNYLNLGRNQLATLPPEIGQLGELEVLTLDGNDLTALPPEMGRLRSLRMLYLRENALRELPQELGQIEHFKELELGGNSLSYPPPEIVEQGPDAILAFLRDELAGGRQQWLSKLLLVGEGGVGKSSLLRSLRGQLFDPELETTHGIEVGSLALAHPTEPGVSMALRSWDFGGQEIYHATHQFFLTNRSLFLVVWNARMGYEQGRLYYWLDMIQALAPESPVLLVATHVDQREAELPYSELQSRYPQIAGPAGRVSNRSGEGVEALREAIAQAAAGLPLMGERWPAAWLDAAEAVRARPEKHISPRLLREVMGAQGVEGESARVLAQWLHDLGDILYYQEDEALNDLVILKPQWVTEYISRVLESEEVIQGDGVFSRTQMDQLWEALAPAMRDHFLRLMERFDLSYRTLEDREISLVVERLPLDPPEYEPAWQAIQEQENCHEIAMHFQLNTVPAGIPTWFIARSHRFSTHTHWRNGALFAYSSERRHLALVRVLPHERRLELTVRGPAPYNFFALLKDGVELTLRRFPGLSIARLIPCPGHGGERCSHQFNYAHLQKALERQPPVLEIQCPASFEPVSVPGLLFGFHWRTQEAVLERIDRLESRVVARQEAAREEILAELQELRALSQREFTALFRREQSRIETHCPNVFVLRPRDRRPVWEAIAGRSLELQLYCQAPGCWHPTAEGGRYRVEQPAEWIRVTAPYLRRLCGMLRYVAPLLGPWVSLADADYAALIERDLAFMAQLAQQLPELSRSPGAGLAEAAGLKADPERAGGAALRALRALLEEKDPQGHWGGLRKVLTPEGHYLWLCEHHAQEYLW